MEKRFKPISNDLRYHFIRDIAEGDWSKLVHEFEDLDLGNENKESLI